MAGAFENGERGKKKELDFIVVFCEIVQLLWERFLTVSCFLFEEGRAFIDT